MYSPLDKFGYRQEYLAAFDVARAEAKKALFVVHRENIARAAKKSFKRIMPTKRGGMYTGSEKTFLITLRRYRCYGR